MELAVSHDWDVTPARAIAIQRELRARVVARDELPDTVQTVAGVDVGFEDGGRITRAAVVVLSYPDLLPLTSELTRVPTTFPYVPGLLSFRELPALLTALERLRNLPDVILCDGHGIAHPRRLGIASHLGVLLDRPTIGVAKSRLIGTFQEPHLEKGSTATLFDGDDQIGAVVRTRSGVKPLFVSVGHKVSLFSAVKTVLSCTTRYRLPETTRAADRLASRR